MPAAVDLSIRRFDIEVFSRRHALQMVAKSDCATVLCITQHDTIYRKTDGVIESEPDVVPEMAAGALCKLGTFEQLETLWWDVIPLPQGALQGQCYRHHQQPTMYVAIVIVV